MNVELKGTVHKISDVITNKDGKYPKKEYIILEPNERDSRYDDYHKIEVSERNFEKFDALKVNDEVVIQVNVRGRLWTNPEGKEVCFESKEGWKVDVVSNSAPVTNIPDVPAAQSEVDDLPF